MEINISKNKLTIYRTTTLKKVIVDREILEEDPLTDQSQEVQDFYKGIIGDGNSKVTIGRELSASDFGNGGKTFVAVTLTCDQSTGVLNYAMDLAKHICDQNVWKHQKDLEETLIEKGVLKPRL